MRGKLPSISFVPFSSRITPADAGKTSLATGRGRTVEDHPRGCGENYQGFAKQNYTMGSPPRMRGKLKRQAVFKLDSRITPADAGKTLDIIASGQR